MERSIKFAISIPGTEFKELEALRKEKGLSRSKLILEAIRFWKEAGERNKLIKIYEEGYKRIPENVRNTEAWEKASLDTFSQGKWS